MALKDKTISVGVEDILNVDGGLAVSVKRVFDGHATGSPLYLSTARIGIGSSTLSSGSHTLSIKSPATGTPAIAMQDTTDTTRAVLGSYFADNPGLVMFDTDGSTVKIKLEGGSNSFTMNRWGCETDNPAAALGVGAGANTLVTDGTITSSDKGINLSMNEASKYAMGIYNANVGGSGLLIKAGDTASEYVLRVMDYDGAAELFSVKGDGSINLGTDTGITGTWNDVVEISSLYTLDLQGSGTSTSGNGGLVGPALEFKYPGILAGNSSSAGRIAGVEGTGLPIGGDLVFETNDMTGSVGFIERLRMTQEGPVQFPVRNGDVKRGTMFYHKKTDTDVTTDGFLGGIGFDSDSGSSTVTEEVGKASAYISAHASETHSSTEKGGYLKFGVKNDAMDDGDSAVECFSIRGSQTSAYKPSVLFKEGSNLVMSSTDWSSGYDEQTGETGTNYKDYNYLIEMGNSKKNRFIRWGGVNNALAEETTGTHPFIIGTQNRGTIDYAKFTIGGNLQFDAVSDFGGSWETTHGGDTSFDVAAGIIYMHMDQKNGIYIGHQAGEDVTANQEVNLETGAILRIYDDDITTWATKEPKVSPVTDDEVKLGDASHRYDVVYSAGSVLTSDQRLKENIQDLGNVLDKINSLKPKTFDWKKHGPKDQVLKDYKGSKIGFLAQEVEEVIPEWVHKDKGDMYGENGELLISKSDSSIYGLKSGGPEVLAYLIKAIQELSAKVTALENK